MIDAPSSTWFTVSPHWRWLILVYFVFGGLAGGTYFLASLIDLFGRPQDRPLARLGYYIALPCLAVSGIVLVVDLSRPDRFWHLFIESNTFQPMFKYWSPMSIGSWAILLFGVFAFVSFVGALAESGRLSWRPARRLRDSARLRGAMAVIGGLLGLYAAGYTGVLLAVTNRPIWSDTPLLGMLLVASATSISAALMILLADRRRWTMPGLRALRRIDIGVIVVEFLALAAVVVSLGPVAQAFLRPSMLALLAGVVLIGMVAPIVLYRREIRVGGHAMTAALLVLTGGVLLRALVVFSPEGIAP